MARPEDFAWAVSVAQVASRPGQSKTVDAVFPAPSGIGDEVIGVKEGADVSVHGSFDSIVDGLVLTARIEAPVAAECTRCLKPIKRDWACGRRRVLPVRGRVGGKARLGTARPQERGRGDRRGGGRVGGRVSAELETGAFADLEALLRDTLVEALPLQPLCRADCRGLCSQCGVDLNEHPDHHHDVTDHAVRGSGRAEGPAGGRGARRQVTAGDRRAGLGTCSRDAATCRCTERMR